MGSKQQYKLHKATNVICLTRITINGLTQMPCVTETHHDELEDFILYLF